MDYQQHSAPKRFRQEAGGYDPSRPTMDNVYPSPPPSYVESNRSHPSGKGHPRKGAGKGMHFGDGAAYVPTTEHRIPVDVNAFPVDSNIIMQLLGPRGRHQQRMKMESDSIVTTSGKGVRGQALYGEEPLTLVIRSKDPAIPLTQRQIASVYQIYEDILKNVKEFGTSDNAGNFVINTNHIVPASLMEFLWNLHLLLSRPRPQDLQVFELFDAYSAQFSGHDCPLSSWLVVESGDVRGALSRIPHIVDLYTHNSIWYMRAANGPDLNYSQLRDIDDAYKMRLQQIAAGRIPLEDLSSGVVTGMLFGLDRVNACTNIIEGILKILFEKKSMDFPALQAEFFELYKVPLNVFELIHERSLLSFLLRFKAYSLFHISNDGTGWKIALDDNSAQDNIDSVVKTVVLVQPTARRTVRVAHIIPPPAITLDEEPATTAATDEKDSIAALVSILQGFKQPAPTPTSSVTEQIQQLLHKKKQQTDTTTAQPASGTALNELMAALQAAKK